MGALVPSNVVNMAAAQLGSHMSVVNYEQDQGTVASTAKIYYEQSLLEILRDFPWPFATFQQKLVLVSHHYSLERRFVYAYPRHCVAVRRLFSGYGYNRNDDAQSRQKYKIARIPAPTGPGDLELMPAPPLPALGPQVGPGVFVMPPPMPPTQPQEMIEVILADQPDLYVEFTGDWHIVADFPADFVRALVFKLAAYMAPKLTGGDPYKLGDKAAAQYNQAIATAAMHAANEEVDDPVRDGEFIDTRGPEHRHHGGAGWFPAPTSVIIGN